MVHGIREGLVAVDERGRVVGRPLARAVTRGTPVSADVVA